MKKEKVIDFVIGITVVSLILYLVLSVYTVYKTINDTSDAIMAGIIGFTGAIIGGYLTWRGVKVSVEHQKEKDRLEKLPNVLKYTWRIHKYITFGTATTLYLIGNPNISKEFKQKTIKDFYEKTEEDATEIALDISPEMYRLIMRYYTLLSEFDLYHSKGEVDVFSKKLEMCEKEFSDMLSKYENEYEILANKLKVEL